MADYKARINGMLTGLISRAGVLLAIASVDQGDGTGALMTSTAAQTSISTSQTSLTGAASAVQITSATPAASRNLVQVTNSGAATLWVGPTGVTASTGIPIATGATMSFALGSGVPLFGFSTSGSTAAVAEFA
jgi:hypothetical protein